MDDTDATHDSAAHAHAETVNRAPDAGGGSNPAVTRGASREAWSGPGPGFLVRFAQLTALVAFAVAQPLYDVLERHPTFLALHGVRAMEIGVVIVLGQLVVPALGALALRALAGWRPGLELALRALLVGVGAMLTALPPLERWQPEASLWPAGLALAVGAGFGWTFGRWPTLRLYVAGLSVAAVVFAASFLVGSSARPAQPTTASPSERAAPIPVVLVVLDELPFASLVAPDGGIDERRLPSFARLARASTWFANTTTPHPTTRTAIPALCTGRVVDRPGSIPTLADHPTNLFTWLEPTHELEVSGSLRELCPADRRGADLAARARVGRLLDDLAIVWAHVVVPRAWRDRLPPVDDTWVDFRAGEPRERRDAWRARLLGVTTEDRAGQFRAFIDRLARRSGPALYALHVVLPHAPWAYGPSGRPYSAPRKESLADVALERYLLQLGFADRLLGELLDALEARGLFDEALVVVTADHGASFVTADRRRWPTPERLLDIAFVPLFVKLPGQVVGRRDERPAQTIDVVPTILDVVGLGPRSECDGHSLVGPDDGAPRPRALWRESGGPPLELPAVRPETTPLRERIDTLFDAEPGPDGRPRRRDGRGIVGRPVASFAVGTDPLDVGLELEAHGRAEPRSGWTVGYVAGRGSNELPERIALAIDGVVVAIAHRAPAEDGAHFGALVPPGSLDAPNARLAAFGLDHGPPVSLTALE